MTLKRKPSEYSSIVTHYKFVSILIYLEGRGKKLKEFEGLGIERINTSLLEFWIRRPNKITSLLYYTYFTDRLYPGSVTW